MNRGEWSYQLSHVYDKLFAAAATSSGERKLTHHSEVGNSRCRKVNNNLYYSRLFSGELLQFNSDACVIWTQ